jgi:hypothetical protein
MPDTARALDIAIGLDDQRASATVLRVDAPKAAANSFSGDAERASALVRDTCQNAKPLR